MVPWAHPTRVFIQNGMSIASAVFAQRTVECPITLKMGRYVLLQKLPLPLVASDPPSNTWYLWPTRVINPNGISIGSAVFVWVPNAMLYSALSMGKKPPYCPFSWYLVTPPYDDRATAIGNMHKNLVKSRVWFGKYARGQTNTYRRAHYNTSPPLIRAK